MKELAGSGPICHVSGAESGENMPRLNAHLGDTLGGVSAVEGHFDRMAKNPDQQANFDAAVQNPLARARVQQMIQTGDFHMLPRY